MFFVSKETLTEAAVSGPLLHLFIREKTSLDVHFSDKHAQYSDIEIVKCCDISI
jgi:hypothetical protein